jgi:hypothetical protein
MKLEVSEEFVREAHKAACVDWKLKIEEQFPDLFKSTHKLGNRYLYQGDEFILARVGINEVNLISLYNGNRWSDNIKVKDTDYITQNEFKILVGNFEFKIK